MNRNSRGLPYLHRNWVKAMDHWQNMGLKMSSPSRQNGERFMDADDDQYQRPAKRRRLFEKTSDAGFRPDDLGSFLVPAADGQVMSKALRVEVLKIVHKDSARVKFSGIFSTLIAPQVQDVTSTRARCRISISCEKDGEPVVLHVDSQICTMKTFKNPVGPHRMARIHLPQPFHVPQEKILIERDDDDVFSLADSYTILVELESAGDATWPPLNVGAQDDETFFYSRGSSSRRWTLAANVPEVFDRKRKAAAVVLKRKAEIDLLTDYVMDVDMRWTSGLSSAAMAKRLEKDLLPSITVIDPTAATPVHLPTVNGNLDAHSGINGVNGHVNGHHLNGDKLEDLPDHSDLMDDGNDGAEGELTPSRTRRARHQINYNLKLLSDQAAGREKRRRRKLDGKHDSVDDYRVMYILPPEQFAVDDFKCGLCGAAHRTFIQLRIHLLGHDAYQFDFDLRPKGVFQVSVGHRSETIAAVSPIRPKVYQLGRPLKPLDLEQYVDGDDSWITSRLGSENDRDFGPTRMVAPKAFQVSDSKSKTRPAH
jgi:hypothetical protein